MKNKLSNSKNEELKNETRQSNLDQFTVGLVALMNMQESIKVKDSEFSNKFDQEVFSSTKTVEIEMVSLMFTLSVFFDSRRFQIR
ncbi:hypothetical protein D3C76_562190 [compost metagenome]